MPRVAAPADKRFRRAQVKPSRARRPSARQLWLAARVLAVVAVLAYGGWRGSALLLGAPALEISRIAVGGHERLSAGEVLALVDGLRGEHLLTVRLERYRERLLASPWVEEATLRRVVPSTVEVVVRERRPMGIARLGRALYLVDPHGVIIDEYGPAYADLDLPMIDGLAAAPDGEGTLVDDARASLAARVLAALATRPDLAARVSQIDVGERRDAVVLLDGDTVRLRLGDRDFVERLQEYLDLGPALRARVPEIDYVDLRFDERLYVRPVRPEARTKTQ